MMEILFKFINQYILVKINGNNIYFGNTGYGNQLTTIEGLKLDKSGVIKQHPDLKDRDDWRQEAIKRFKEHIKNMNEQEKADYIISDLANYGYKAIQIQYGSKRPEYIR